LIRINADSRIGPIDHYERVTLCWHSQEEEMVDKDRIIGSAKVVKGKVKEAVGKAVGDAKLEAEGKADKIEGKVQNAVGGVKDTLKGK
jgi:uncharacterized protein YjbJ (UPF0337 family)